MERDGAEVTCDGRLFHRRAAATGNALLPTVDSRLSRVRRTARDTDEPNPLTEREGLGIRTPVRSDAAYCQTMLKNLQKSVYLVYSSVYMC